MNIKETCHDIISLYEDHTISSRDRGLAYQLVAKLRVGIELDTFTSEDLKAILQTTKKVAISKGNLKQILEKELLSLIAHIPIKLWHNTDETTIVFFDREIKNEETEMAELLIDFTKEIYEVKLDRDAFSGKRRGYAIQILENLSYYFEVPEFLQLCTKSITSKSKNEYLDCIESLKNYCLEKNYLPDESLISVIDKRIGKTKHRVEATGGLIFQVDTGIINEFEAMSRLDEWKEKNENW